MNQILFNKKINKKYKYIFSIQLIISIFIAITLVCIMFIENKKNNNLENISKIINKNVGLSSIYQTDKVTNTGIYLGKIIIEKIKLEYTVFNNFDEGLLKIAPCKFYGSNIGEKGNICVAGHNYNDNRFFRKNI